MPPRIRLPISFSSRPFTYADGLAAGLGRGRLDGGDLGRPFHGVRHPDGEELPVAELCRAFAVRMPPESFFSSVTAAQLMRLPVPLAVERDRRIHVAVPSPGRAIRSKGVIGHTVQLMGGDCVVSDGLRRSSPERVWCELAAVLPLDALVAAGDQLIHHRAPLTTIERLHAAVTSYPSPVGKPLLRKAVTLLDGRAESAMESRTRLLLLKGDLPGFRSNLWIATPAARYRVDFAFPDYRTYIEYQGIHHFDIEQWRRDMTRRSRLEAVAWRGIEISVRDLEHPTELIARISSVLRLQGWSR